MDIIATYKPTGLKTHRSSDQRSDWGYAEWLEEKWGEKLYLFQRLDAGTSGLLLFAKSESAARDWTDKLKHKKVNKTYLMITKGVKPNQSEFTFQSTITKIKGQWVSHKPSNKNEAPNSETHFIYLRSHQDFHLWQAHPKTGKAHQIRLHAQDLGHPILGDALHGGAPFFRLCLHALKMEDPESKQNWVATAPPYFDNLDLLRDHSLCALLEAHHQREQLIKMKILPAESYRLAHFELPWLRVDSFGENLWVYNYSNSEINPTPLFADFFNHTKSRPTWVREMKNRGENPLHSQLIKINDPQNRWDIKENNLVYELRANQGLSPGLFLDQRENRLWVKNHSASKKILNLFSYTCGFSLCAAAGGATEVVSVDVSTPFLEWGKYNFSLNQLNPQNYEFRNSDVLEFLKRTLKIKRMFDLIICDPPSFGRSKKSVFNIEKDLGQLTQLCFQLLSPAGKLLLSTNFEKWSWDDFKNIALTNINKNDFDILNEPLPGLDFIEPQQRILKTLLLQKK